MSFYYNLFNTTNLSFIFYQFSVTFYIFDFISVFYKKKFSTKINIDFYVNISINYRIITILLMFFENLIK